jgi:pimeloyl-ACP methyl ester carboxylesterase
VRAVRAAVEWVPVAGGTLAVHRLNVAGPSAPMLIALHSISANAVAWQPVADALAGEVHVVAPDLRGRAESAHLRSSGLADHARDAVAVADHLGVERPLLAGHAMGAFAAALGAATTPERVAGVVLVDGGIGFAPLGTVDVDEGLHRVIGPAMDRLTMSFADHTAYLDYWRTHPTLGPLLDGPGRDYLAAYLLHDLAGPPGAMRSTSSCSVCAQTGRT